MSGGGSPPPETDSDAAAHELEIVFGRATGAPLRLTRAGLFLATPPMVLAAACRALLAAPSLQGDRPLTVLDAGSGDGRVLAALGLVAPAARRLRLVGIECDPDLHKDSCDRIAALVRRPAWPPGRGAALLEGDWSDPAAFQTLGLTLEDFDLVLNYPDGSQDRLAALLAERGRPGGRLALLQPDPPAEPPGCRTEWRHPVPAGPDVRWHLALAAWPG